MASTITVIRSHCITPTKPNLQHAVPEPFRLSALDSLVHPSVPVAVVFVYTRGNRELASAERLVSSIATLLNYYPYLSGRLHLNASHPQISHTGKGVAFVEAECTQRLVQCDSLEALPGGGIDLLVPYDRRQWSSEPIFSLQLTRFACGSVTLGVRLLHAVGDAAGFFQIMRHLSEIYRVGTISGSPSLTPYLLSSDNSFSKTDLAYQPSLFHLSDGSPEQAYPPPETQVVGNFFRLSRSQLEEIKSLATPGKGWISTFDALCAFFAQAIYRARTKIYSPTDLSPLDFLSPVNIRLRHTLPPHYPFNALLCTYTSLDRALDGSLSDVAQRIHEMTRTPATTIPNELESTLRWLSAQPDKSRIRQGFRFGNGSLMISSWSKLDMYGVDFGQRPTLVSTPFTPISLIDGLGYFLPTPNAGEMEICMALGESVWKELDKDEEFKRFLRAE